MKRVARLVSDRVGRHGRLARQVAEQSAANIAIQGLGAVTTLSFVNLLPTHEYAIFALCLTTSNFLSITSDLGLMSSLNYFWRSTKTADALFEDRYAAIRRVRLMLFLVAGAIAVGVLVFLGLKQGAPVRTVLLTAALTLGLAWLQVNAQMLVVPLRLAQKLRLAYAIELGAAVVRVSLALLAFVLAWAEAWVPLASMAVAALLTLVLARRHVPPEIVSRRKPSRESMRAVGAYILPTIPGTFIFATQDAFVYWLASISGGATVVAQAFALGRLAAIFVMLNSIMSNVIVPRLVNVRDDRRAHRNGLLPIVLIAFFCGVIVIAAGLFPAPFLFVLGEKYSGLGIELVLSLATATLALLATMLGQVSRTMGWVRWETPLIFVHAGVALAVIPFFTFTTTQGVLSYSLALAGFGLAKMIAIHVLGSRGIDPPWLSEAR